MTTDYWQRRGERFAGFYGRMGRLDPRRIVRYFLNTRTCLVSSLTGVGPLGAVLDLGCGSGIHLRLLGSRSSRLAGIDTSAGMLGVARVTLRAAGLEADLRQSDAASVPFEDASFDWVVCLGVLDYVDDIGRVTRECRRVLRRGGYAVLSAPRRPSVFAPLRSRVGNVLKRVVFDLPPVRNVLSHAELVALLDESGFRLQALASVWTTMWVVKARAGDTE